MEKLCTARHVTMTIWGMRITYWIPTAMKTDAEYATLTAFTLQQWLHEVSSVLHVHSVEQKSINLKFSKSRTGSHMTPAPSWEIQPQQWTDTQPMCLQVYCGL